LDSMLHVSVLGEQAITDDEAGVQALTLAS
jgi:hypothetical protein